ncbi:YbaB/EbfC family nucleoid-associated protein [candidate division WOR-3 bacterium]|nr:YbaB/EbfC family nucleoid-associated protein [candidate division WOR-3 bacterium]
MKQADLLKKAQEIQNKIAGIMAAARGEATSGGGMVKAVADGNGTILGLKIEKEVIDPEENQMLEDLVIAAVNEARRKAKEAAQTEVQKVIGIPLPGLF